MPMPSLFKYFLTVGAALLVVAVLVVALVGVCLRHTATLSAPCAFGTPSCGLRKAMALRAAGCARCTRAGRAGGAERRGVTRQFLLELCDG